MSQALLRSLIWTDYRLALLFTVFIPLTLLIWAFVIKSEAIQRLLTIYWRVASLLAITVYLMIGNFPISFVTGFLARLLIPISLWFWVDLNEEIHDQRSNSLKIGFTAWRWAVSIYSVLGAIGFAFFLPCGFSQTEFQKETCRLWLDPAVLFQQLVHGAGTPAQRLGWLGLIGLIIYVLYLIYFLFFRLGKQGRSAVEQ